MEIKLYNIFYFMRNVDFDRISLKVKKLQLVLDSASCFLLLLLTLLKRIYHRGGGAAAGLTLNKVLEWVFAI